MENINEATPVAYLTVEQLRELFAGLNAQAETSPDAETRPLIYGLSDLAKFLKCSRPTAAKLIKSGRISCIKTGRNYIFDRTTVLSELGHTKKPVSENAIPTRAEKVAAPEKRAATGAKKGRL